MGIIWGVFCKVFLGVRGKQNGQEPQEEEKIICNRLKRFLMSSEKVNGVVTV